jgi:hypothetical protein
VNPPYRLRFRDRSRTLRSGRYPGRAGANCASACSDHAAARRYGAGVAGADGLAMAGARGKRWLPDRPVQSIEDAARFVEDVSFALLFPTERPVAPSLWEAVAGPDAAPFAHGMGPAESMVWTWKDLLPEAGLAWYGRFLRRRACLISPVLLAALYPGRGEPEDHQLVPLPAEAHRIGEALAATPLPSSALRALVGHRGRYDRAINQLHQHLLVTSAGVREQRSGWRAVVIDLTCRRFDVGDGADRRYATRRFLDTMIEVTPTELSRAFGWPAVAARTALEDLVADRLAVRSPGGYRATHES